jgi:flagellar capping protein FliD
MQIESSALTYSNPIGESGIKIRGANKNNSALRVFVFETQHKAAQRRTAENHGLEVKKQDIQLKYAPDGEGGVVVTGGQTSTEIEDAAGKSTSLNELALLSDIGKGQYASAAAFFGDSRRALPQMFLFDSFASRLRVENRDASFDLNKSNKFLSALTGSERADKTGSGLEIDRVEGKLNSIAFSLRKLNALSPFTNRKVRVSDSLLQINGFTNEAGTGRNRVEVKQIAKSQRLAFDVVKSDKADLNVGGNPLGPEGSFKINGVSLQVKTNDSLVDLKNLINYGEDVNRNNRLDYSEDRNFNRILDANEDLNQNGLLDTTEDINGDGILDAGEDLNLNSRLDVSEDRNLDFKLNLGTASHGVRAEIYDDVLILEAVDADRRVFVQDDNDVLKSLGLQEKDYSGETIFKNEIFAGQEALVTVNGQDLTSADNRFKEAIEGVDFSVQAHLQQNLKLTVELSVKHLLNGIGDVVDAFGLLQEEVNNLLSPKGIFRDNEHLQDVKSEGINSFRFEKSPPPDVPAALEAYGLTRVRERSSLDELTIRQADQRLKQGNESPFDHSFGLPTVRNMSGHFGLTGDQDAVIELDGKHLGQILETKPANAEEKLGTDGFSGRLNRLLNRALDKNGGHLSFIRNMLAEFDRQDLLKGLDEKTRAQLGSQLNLVG